MAFMLGPSDFFVPKDGVNRVRILPSWDPASHPEFYFEVPTHYEVTPECRALICRKMIGEPCPIEDYIQMLSQSENPTSRERARRMESVVRVMVNVHPVRGTDIKVWSMSENLLQQILSVVIDHGYSNLTHAQKGHNLRVLRAGQGASTRYVVNIDPSPSAITLKGWPERMYNLRDHFQPPTLQEVRTILRGNRAKNH